MNDCGDEYEWVWNVSNLINIFVNPIWRNTLVLLREKNEWEIITHIKWEQINKLDRYVYVVQSAFKGTETHKEFLLTC